MKPFVYVVGALALLAFPAGSFAQVEVGARIGFLWARGNALDDPASGQPGKLTDVIASQVPVQLDAAYRISSALSIGAYFSYGFGRLGRPLRDDCSMSGVDCSNSNIRLGVQGIYTLRNVSPSFTPWVGMSVGYEWMRIESSGSGISTSATLSGWEFLALQVGADFAVADRLSIGPYAQISLSQYRSIDARVNGRSFSQEVPDKALHEWAGLGIRGTFELGRRRSPP